MKEQRLYLRDILECINLIKSYVSEGKLAFLKTKMIQDAVIRNLEIIGEATKKLSPEIREKHSRISWKQIAGLRDILIHDYLRIDLEEVWGIISDYLPELKVNIERIVNDLKY